MSFDITQWEFKEPELFACIEQQTPPELLMGVKIIFQCLIKHRGLMPQLRFTTQPKEAEYVAKWLTAYTTGFDNRPSQRKGKPSGTIPDSLIQEIYQETHKVDDQQLRDAAKGHAVMMSLEKTIGDLLEEYLHEKLGSLKWYCCWGQTFKAVDFCQENGALLQIKTSDNSENSSSKRIRDNTEIKVWFRRYSAKKDAYNWDQLKELTGCKDLSEDDFRKFVKELIQTNPNCIHVEDQL